MTVRFAPNCSVHAKGKGVVINHAPKKPPSATPVAPAASTPFGSSEPATPNPTSDAKLPKDVGKPKVITPKMKALLGIDDEEDSKLKTCEGGDPLGTTRSHAHTRTHSSREHSRMLTHVYLGTIKFRNNGLYVCTETGWWNAVSRGLCLGCVCLWVVKSLFSLLPSLSLFLPPLISLYSLQRGMAKHQKQQQLRACPCSKLATHATTTITTPPFTSIPNAPIIQMMLCWCTVM